MLRLQEWDRSKGGESCRWRQKLGFFFLWCWRVSKARVCEAGFVCLVFLHLSADEENLLIEWTCWVNFLACVRELDRVAATLSCISSFSFPLFCAVVTKPKGKGVENARKQCCCNLSIFEGSFWSWEFIFSYMLQVFNYVPVMSNSSDPPKSLSVTQHTFCAGFRFTWILGSCAFCLVLVLFLAFILY